MRDCVNKRSVGFFAYCGAQAKLKQIKPFGILEHFPSSILIERQEYLTNFHLSILLRRNIDILSAFAVLYHPIEDKDEHIFHELIKYA